VLKQKINCKKYLGENRHENIAAPGGNHVEIRKSSQASPEDGSSSHGAHPEKIGKLEGKYGNSFLQLFAFANFRNF
jgi:hypothetical protein